MYFLIDESVNPKYDESPQMNWCISVIGGAILPYNKKKKWLAQHRELKKGFDFKPNAPGVESEICSILDYMYQCRIKAVVLINDIGFTKRKEAENLRLELINPLYPFANKEPLLRGEKLKRHLDHLLNNFNLQDFYKTWNILETIQALIQWYLGDLGSLRLKDINKLTLMIDDQVLEAQVTLKEFIHFFMFCRSSEGVFKCPSHIFGKGFPFFREENGAKYMNTNLLFHKILVGKLGEKMDDKYPELKIADFLANIARKTLKGAFSFTVAQKLKRIIKVILPFQAGPSQERGIDIPEVARINANLLMSEHIF